MSEIYYDVDGHYVKLNTTDSTAKVVETLPTSATTSDLKSLADEKQKKAVQHAASQAAQYGMYNVDADKRKALWENAQKNRWAYVDENDKVAYGNENLKANELGLGLSDDTVELPNCRHPRGSRVYQLRKLLVTELNKIAESNKNNDDDTCMQVCDEDRDMLKMMKKYQDLQNKKIVKCTLASFDNDPKLKLLAAKRAMLDRMSFAYLHGECEGSNRCNPYGDKYCVEPKLIPCLGLNEPDSLLFGDDQLAGIGREIAGKQRHGDSPAARGFAANLFQTNTLAPGAKRKNGEPSIWVNICYPVVDSISSFASPSGKLESANGMTMAVKWIEANAMETAKYYTMQALNAAIRKQKKRILAVNRQMLTLQTRLSHISPGDSLGVADAGYNGALENMDLFVQNTVGGIKNQLIRRQAEKNLKESRDVLDMQMAVAAPEERREYMRQLRKMGLDGERKSRSRSKGRNKGRNKGRSRSRSKSRSRSRSRNGRRSRSRR